MKKERHPEATEASPLEAYKKRRAALAAVPAKAVPKTLGRVEQLAALTQAGVAEILAEKHKSDFVYCPEVGWLHWNGQHWDIKGGQDIVEYSVQEIGKDLFEKAVALSDEAQVLKAESMRQGGEPPNEAKAKEKEALQWIALGRQCRSDKGARGVASLARCSPAFRASLSDFDQDRWLLNCANGTLNLKTRELYPHRQSDRITRALKTPYLPEAKCERWIDFMYEVALGDHELVVYMQQFMGLCLTGEVREHAFFILHGNDGRNGKSVMLTLLLNLLGPYGTQIASEMLLSYSSNPNAHSVALWSLRGIRAAFANETDEGRKLSVARVKELTGGDPIKARAPYAKDEIQFLPELTLVLRTNHIPKTNVEDKALNARLKIIPLHADFHGRKGDRDLPVKLAQEMPGILAWAVEGLHSYLDKGLLEPKAVTDALEHHIEEQDHFTPFLESQILEKIEAKGIGAAEVATLFNAFAKPAGLEPMDPTQVGKRLKKLGWELKRTKSQRSWFPPASPVTSKKTCHRGKSRMSTESKISEVTG